MYYKLIDEQSGNIKFVGSESEILEFSIEILHVLLLLKR